MSRIFTMLEYATVWALFACAIVAVLSLLQPPPEPDLSRILEQIQRNDARAAELTAREMNQ